MRLKNIEVREVSIVNKAANGEKFAILKAKDPKPATKEKSWLEDPAVIALLKNVASVVEKLKNPNSQ